MQQALGESDKQKRRAAKKALLGEVLAWSKANDGARNDWATSASEPIELLHAIEAELKSKG